jgi:hypothetical protein
MPAWSEQFVKIAPHCHGIIGFVSGRTGPALAVAPHAQGRGALNSFAAAWLR